MLPLGFGGGIVCVCVSVAVPCRALACCAMSSRAVPCDVPCVVCRVRVSCVVPCAVGLRKITVSLSGIEIVVFIRIFGMITVKLSFH